MAEPQRSRAYVWLAFASALIVLLASGVAISRIGDEGGDGPVAAAPDRAPAGTGGASTSGPVESTTPGADASAGGTAAGAADANAAADSPATSGGTSATGKVGMATAAGQRNANGSSGTPGSDVTGGGAAGFQGDGSQPSGTQSPQGSGTGESPSGAPQGGGSGGSPGSGGEGSPPAPSQQPPEGDSRLMAASVSVGQGAQGGVVAVGTDGGGLDAGVTVGTNQLVGNHPPSQGTGVTFGGRFLQPPPFLPSVSG